MKLDPRAPEMRFSNVKELFRYWGTASEFLHFAGAHAFTYKNLEWTIKAIARLEAITEKLWHEVTTTVGSAIMRPSKMQAEVRQAWEEFAAGTLSTRDVITRLQILQPALRLRRRYSES